MKFDLEKIYPIYENDSDFINNVTKSKNEMSLNVNKTNKKFNHFFTIYKIILKVWSFTKESNIILRNLPNRVNYVYFIT